MPDEDLISHVKIDGVDKAVADLNRLGSAGEKAFTGMDAAAAKSGRSLSAALSGVRQGIQTLQSLKPDAGMIGSIEQLRGSFQRLSNGVSQAGARFQTFQERTRRIATIATGVSVGLIALARTAAKSYDEAGKSQDSNTQAQLRGLQANQEVSQAEFTHGQTLKSLRGEFARGELTFEQYDAKLQDINRSYKEQRVQANFAADQAETLRLETERLTAAAAKTKAFDELSNKFGTTLAGSMITAGRAAGVFIGDLQRSLGPPVAAIVNRVTELFEQNRTKIIATFDAIAASIQAFVAGGGVERTFEIIGQSLSLIGTVITSVVIPAFSALKVVADGVAASVNAVFGTQVSGAALLVVAALGLFTGAFTIALGLLKSVSGAIGLLLGGLRLLPILIGAIGLAVRALAIGFTFLIASMGPIGFAILAITLAVAAFAAAGGDVTRIWGAVVTFFTTTLPQAVTGFFTSIAEFISTSWNQMVETSIAAWEGLVAFFASLPERVFAIFAAMGQSIVDAFNAAVTSVTTTMSRILEAARRYIQPVIDMVTKLAALLGGAEGSAKGGSVGGFAGGGRVRGPGSSTSDSIPAWLSNNEFVMRAKAVRKYGVAFMHAVNRGQLDLGRISRMAMGGLVSPLKLSAPSRFAEGGLATAGRPITLNLSGGEQFNLSASDEEATKIIKYAVKKQTRATGRKPTWVGR